MDQSLIMLMILSLFLGCGCWLFFIWAVHKGEFDDIERPKYRMLEDDEIPGDERDAPFKSLPSLPSLSSLPREQENLEGEKPWQAEEARR